MPRGGLRTPGDGKKIGRPRTKPETPEISINRGFAARVMELIGSKDWTKITKETAKTAEEYALTFLSCGDININRWFFDRLLDRRYGKPPQPVFHGDTRESAPELDFGDLPMPAGSGQFGTTGKPN